MTDFGMPVWVKNLLKKPLNIADYSSEEIQELKQKLSRFRVENPLVSMVIPAWNEEFGILHTLWSLANSDLKYPTELIIVDNNSTDGTSNLLHDLGIKTVSETKQGVGHARTTGLAVAQGKYVLTGDSDTLYPPQWINLMIDAFQSSDDKPVYCVHSTYSFIPENPGQRWMYGIYELLSSFISKRKEKNEPYLNVYGFYMGFEAQKGRDVNGYDIEVQRTFRGTVGQLETNATEDGMMALRLMQAGGKIKAVHDSKAKVWTSDRRIQLDGGIVNAFKIRFKKYLSRK